MPASYTACLRRRCYDNQRFSHECAAMPLECDPWQTLREYIRRLVFTCNFVKSDLRLRSGSKLPHPVHSSINVLCTSIHATTFHEKYACVVILRDGSGFLLWIAHWFTAKLQSPLVNVVRYIQDPMSC